jgi:hypothetical protein
MPYVGSIEAYDVSENLSAYLERVHEFFLANDIGQVRVADGADLEARQAAANTADRKKVASFLTILGKKTYGVLQDLCKPAKPNEKTFNELCDLLKSHYEPKTLEVAESFKFHRCVQDEKDTVAEFCARLRGMAATCNFGQFLNRSLRDQFISGIRNKDTQRKLLETDRDFNACVDVAIADEAAMRESQHFSSSSNSTSTTVNVMRHSKNFKSSFAQKGMNPKSRQKPTSNANSNTNSTANSAANPNVRKYDSKSKYVCFSCGKSDHSREKCRFRNSVCNICQRRGHISTVCNQPEVNELTEEFSDEEASGGSDLLSFSELYSLSAPTINVSLVIQGHDVDIQLDTGCALSLASEIFYAKYCENVPLKPCDKILFTYTGEQVAPLGECTVEVLYNDELYKLPLLIVPGKGTALFGRNWLQSIKLNWQSLRGLNFIRPLFTTDHATTPDISSNMQLPDLLCKYKVLFENKLGLYNGPPVELDVETVPKFHKARQVPYALQPRVEEALQEMVQNNILERIEH